MLIEFIREYLNEICIILIVFGLLTIEFTILGGWRK